jgi:hypothetical protein
MKSPLDITIGIFMDKYGGKSAKIALAYLKWLLKGDKEAKKSSSITAQA